MRRRFVFLERIGRLEGTGRERVRRKLNIHVPAGVDDGFQLEMEGQGELGLYGGPTGSLYITVSVKPHKFFKRDGANILFDLPVNFAQAALGAEVEVPTVEGKPVLLKVPAGVQSGRMFRLRGKGVHLPDDRGRGDELVYVRVITPQSLDHNQKKLLEELARTLPATKMPGEADEDDGLLNRVKGIFGEK